MYRGRGECQKAVSRAAMLVEISGSARQASKNSDSVTTPSLLPKVRKSAFESLFVLHHGWSRISGMSYLLTVT
ncbi:hypothetical protein ALC56_05929 [Trachymyrmex septentrionalis]|uniref:Uncharacterized protein n=1 Tax=Trachymyrmex septentrionalis TaxID=34720 RepID=A0A195FGC6_9HYME|nr:hypothetical protein ALC56_05929 [Trachymyrmex septentrionalis]